MSLLERIHKFVRFLLLVGILFAVAFKIFANEIRQNLALIF